MLRYLYMTFGFFCALLGLHLVLFSTQIGLPSESSRWIDESYSLKTARIRSISGSKIIIVSGSNALFSLEAREIEKQLGVPVVNYATHAGLQLDYLLYKARQIVSKGDIILLPLEYDLYNYQGETTGTLADYISSRDSQFLMSNYKLYFNCAFSFSICDLVFRNLYRFWPEDRIVGYYDASYLDAWGDKTNTQRSLIQRTDIEGLRSLKPSNFVFNENSHASAVLVDFIDNCRDRDVQVVFTYPTFLYFDAYKSASFLENAEKLRKFVESHGAVFIGNPYDFMFPMEDFFNTAYHANEVGRSLSTARLIPLLRDYLDSSQRDVK
jgi:hypothetical protein